MRNARQILGVLTATFPSFQEDGPSEKCEEFSSSIDELACQWRGITQSLPQAGAKDEDIEPWVFAVNKVCSQVLSVIDTADTQQWLKQAQEIMSSTASNYDVKKLATGLMVAAVALFLGSAAAGPTITASLESCFPMIAVTFLYGIMMFASSYVEEEHHFWYWATSGWLVALWIKS